MLEEEGAAVGILIADDVVQNDLDGSDLVTLQSIVNCRPVEILTFHTFFNLIFIKHWEIAAEIVAEFLLQQILNRLALEAEDANHVGTI
jgi:hypothetical protein